MGNKNSNKIYPITEQKIDINQIINIPIIDNFPTSIIKCDNNISVSESFLWYQNNIRYKDAIDINLNGYVTKFNLHEYKEDLVNILLLNQYINKLTVITNQHIYDSDIFKKLSTKVQSRIKDLRENDDGRNYDLKPKTINGIMLDIINDIGNLTHKKINVRGPLNLKFQKILHWKLRLKQYSEEFINREKLLCDNYFVVYSAWPAQFNIYYDILRILKSILNLELINLYNKVVRDKYSKYMNVHDYFNKTSYNVLLEGDSENLSYPEHFLSVNLSLFGNALIYGSSSVIAFIENETASGTSEFDSFVEQKLKEIFTQLGIIDNNVIIKDILNYHNIYFPKYKDIGSLNQIFIKKSVINDLLYISRRLGYPLIYENCDARKFLQLMQDNKYNEINDLKLTINNTFDKILETYTINKQHIEIESLLYYHYSVTFILNELDKFIKLGKRIPQFGDINQIDAIKIYNKIQIYENENDRKIAAIQLLTILDNLQYTKFEYEKNSQKFNQGRLLYNDLWFKDNNVLIFEPIYQDMDYRTHFNKLYNKIKNFIIANIESISKLPKYKDTPLIQKYLNNL